MNQYIRYTIAVLFAIIGGTICFWTNTQLGENIIFNGIETLVSASILGGYIYFLFNPEENAQNNVINNDRNRWWMYFLLNDKLYITTSIKLSFLPRSMDLVHCILPSRRIQPLQDNEEDSGRQIESNS